MEVIFSIIGLFMIVVASFDTMEPRSFRIKLAIASTFLVIIPWILAWMFTTTTEIIHTDILTHDGITYSTPQTLIEIRHDAPFWSAQDSSEFILVEK